MPVLLSCHGIGKAFTARPLFDDITFAISTGEHVGLIGPNGSGKSTFLRILAGLETPGSGTCARGRQARIVYQAQQDALIEGDTVASALHRALRLDADGREEYEYDLLVEETVAAYGFAGPDQDVARMSGGWRKRLAIAMSLIRQPDLLLIDEPTNHLDLAGILWLEETLRSAAFAFIVVSHDRYFLDRVAARVVELNRIYPGGHFTSQGGYGDFMRARAAFFQAQARQQESLDNKVRRESEWLARGPKARTTKAQSRIDGAERMMDELAELSYRNAQSRTASIDFTATGRRTNDLVVLTGVDLERGGRRLVHGLDLTISPGMKLGLLGLNGTGKTTLLRAIAGQLPPAAGTIKLAQELRVVVFDQKRDQLDRRLPLRRALCPTGDTVIFRGRPIHIMAWSKRFLFQPEQLDLAVGSLSGGEQARVLIANLMLKPADLLLLDEPTNDLDIPSLEVLEESVQDFPGAVVLVTHDRFMLDRLSTLLIGLDGAGGCGIFADYRQWESHARTRLIPTDDDARPRAAAPAPARAPARSAGAAAPAGRGLSGRERRELAGIEARIASAEAEVQRLQTAVAAPGASGDSERLATLCRDLAAAEAAVELLYARWSALEAAARAAP
jgi:ATP-binding cassette subfamily F protein uup